MERTVSDIIDACGGDDALGKALGKHRTTINNWRRKGIPDRYWAKVMALTGATEAELLAANRCARGEPASSRPNSERGDRNAA